MPQNFIRADRDQGMLLAPDLRDWLPAEHLAWFVIDSVEQLDLSAFYGDYRADGHGRPAHDPGMMVALLVYAYAVGCRSSRQIERRCAEDIAFRVIAANQMPDHATIARFRSRHERALADLFGGVLGLCANAGLVSLGTVVVDGTKIRAMASGHATRSYEQIACEILAEAAAVDAAEDEQFGERRGDELPPELADRRSRLARLRAAKAKLEADKQAELDAHQARLDARAQREADEQRRLRGPKPKPPASEIDPGARVNVTDPDSRPMRTVHGFVQGYNAQLVCNEQQIVLAAEVLTTSSDGGQFGSMMTSARHELRQIGIDREPEIALADAGYWDGEQIQHVIAGGTQVLLPPDKDHARRGIRHSGLARFMRSVFDRPDAQTLYAKRKWIIEPVFGDLKHNRHVDRFQRRGQPACRSELRLIAATHNLLKLWRHQAATA